MIRITFPGIQPSTDVAKWQQPSHLTYLTLFIGGAARLIGILGVATLPETLLLSDQVCQESFGSVVARLPGNFVSHVRTLVA